MSRHFYGPMAEIQVGAQRPMGCGDAWRKREMRIEDGYFGYDLRVRAIIGSAPLVPTLPPDVR